MFICHSAMAQDMAIDREIKTIDTLIYYNHFQQAEDKVDSLYTILKNHRNKKLIAQQLELRYRKALIIDNRFEHVDALPIFMEVLQGSEKYNLYHLLCKTNIRIAFNQEKSDNFYLAYQYLHAALKLSEKHHFPELKSTIYIRYSLVHKFLGNNSASTVNGKLIEHAASKNHFSLDSAFYYAEKAIDYAKKYNNEYDLNEGYATLGILENLKNQDTEKAIKYYLKTIPYWQKVKNEELVGIMYLNVSNMLIKQNNFHNALIYSDSAYRYHDKVTVYYKGYFPKFRALCYEKLGNIDSAYHYIKIANDDELELSKKEELINNKRLEEQYQSDKKEAVIKNREQQLFFIGGLLAVIIFGTVLLVRKNREISRKNKIINKQLAELSKTLEQKQMLLSELQHRVKNNLQHVISILEIQKESVDFNNIEELIRGNQNRIHSMALLHKKLNVADNVNDVDLKRYITELSELVKDSYDNHKKTVNLNIKCDVETMSIEKALSVGLIVVELVSNSMKHAFKKRNIGIIEVEITKSGAAHRLYYADNGDGYDFNKTSEKGLGQEIVKGLIDQLDGRIETKSSNGFELTVYFT
jgi:two-component sensor histidine kinase